MVGRFSAPYPFGRAAALRVSSEWLCTPAEPYCKLTYRQVGGMADALAAIVFAPWFTGARKKYLCVCSAVRRKHRDLAATVRGA